MGYPSKSAAGNSEFEPFYQSKIATNPFDTGFLSYEQGNADIYPARSEPAASAGTVKYSWDSASEEEDEDRRGSSSDDDQDQEQNHGRGDENHHHHRLGKMVFEIYEKFPERIRNQLNLEELFTLLRERKARRHSKRKVKITTTSRGGNGPLDDLSKKLERFKIRTVIVEDTDKQKEGVKL